MADEIIRLDYSAEDIGDNIDEVRTARGTFDTLDDRLDNIEGGGPSPSNPIASNCVSPMTGYSKSSSSTPGNISTSDTLNAAIGKLEKRTELNENNISTLYKVGSANILKNTAQTQTVGGVTFTMNADGSITANGTKTDNEWLYLSTGNSLKAGTYVLSSGGVIGDDKLVIVTTGNTLGSAIMTTNTTTGVYERELTQDYSNLYYAIRIASGTVCDNLTFKPMLCEKKVYEAINGEFQPYAMTNAEITAWILAHS